MTIDFNDIKKLNDSLNGIVDNSDIVLICEYCNGTGKIQGQKNDTCFHCMRKGEYGSKRCADHYAYMKRNHSNDTCGGSPRSYSEQLNILRKHYHKLLYLFVLKQAEGK